MYPWDQDDGWHCEEAAKARHGRNSPRTVTRAKEQFAAEAKAKAKAKAKARACGVEGSGTRNFE